LSSCLGSPWRTPMDSLTAPTTSDTNQVHHSSDILPSHCSLRDAFLHIMVFRYELSTSGRSSTSLDSQGNLRLIQTRMWYLIHDDFIRQRGGCTYAGTLTAF
jgi:hypothetical protein